MKDVLGVLLMATLLASACSSGSATGAAPSGQGPETSVGGIGSESAAAAAASSPLSATDTDTTSVPQGDSVADGATSMAASSPIGAFFADDGGFEAAIAEYRLQVRENILVCMAEQGFEFAVTETATRNEVDERQADLTLREWTSEFGFGISTSFNSVAQNQASNPNGAILRSMGEAERELWALTLNGVGLDGLGGGGNQISNRRPLEEQGCIGQAIIATGGRDAIEGLGNFGAVYEEGEAALLERREVIEVVANWSRCMGAEGFIEFAALDDPEDEVRTQFGAIVAPIRPALAALSDEEGQALLSGESLDIDKLPGLDVDALRDLQEYERDLAVADLDCYQAEVQAVYEPLRDEFENRLLEEYAAEFAAVKNLGS